MATTVTLPSMIPRSWNSNLSSPHQNGPFWTKKTHSISFTLSLSSTKISRSRSSSSSSSSTTLPAALPFDLSPPPIDHDFLDALALSGTKVSDDGIVETFDNDDEALDAVDNGVVVVDLSHYGRIRVSGEDRIQFLHNQSTADFECLHEGQGCDTVFVTPTARTIDLSHAWIMKNAVLLVVSPVTCQSITEMLNKYIFPADKVEIQDITKQTSLFVLAGPRSNQVMEGLNLGDLVGQPYGTHRHFSVCFNDFLDCCMSNLCLLVYSRVNGMPVTVGVGNIISEEGFSLLLTPAAAESVWKTILSLGAIPMGSNAWEKLRVLQGRPAPQKELTNEFNVLEAHLWNSISLNKGCYKGQETISRLVTYDGVKQRLWGIHLSAPAEPGSPITINGKKVGKVTSYASGRKESEHFGLGYIKRQAASEGDTVVVGDNITGTVVEVPFLAQQCPPSRGSSS
ncbi:putative transferase At1g60990, chloroplastic isoform X1 [Castanea sativa]|uniref:putative transferase At1g60990, chloroplastic isoform X1 n=1 Tax=Castanea sativa TaxID=21020 RepID=UPI003F64A12A